MFRFATLILLGAMTLTAWAAPRGRVIRVERGTSAADPRFCAIGLRSSESLCFGKPAEGERVLLIDPEQKVIVGELRIDKVTPTTDVGGMGFCSDAGLYSIKGTVVDGEERLVKREALGVRGLKVNRKSARVLTNGASPSGRSTDRVTLTLDANGDGRADLVLTQYACDATGAPATTVEGWCVDTYTAQPDGRLQRTHQDVLKACT